MNLSEIPPADAQVEWNETDDGRVKELVIFNARTSSGPPGDRNGDRFENSAGACTLDWMKGDPRATPEGLFAELVEAGFADGDELLAALDEFGKISTAGWARAMARAKRQQVRAQCYDEDATDQVVDPTYGADPHGDGVALPYYVGSQWKVDAEGIDTIDESYFIDADRLGELYYDDTSSWPQHLAEKNWVDLKDFEHAFRLALKVHSGRYSPLPDSAVDEGFRLARKA